MKARRSSVGCTIATMILVGVMALGFSGPAASQDYPTKAVSMVIGMDPGGVVDVASRVLSEEAKKVLGHEILVENKPGASHMVAGGYVVSSKPDGYVVWGSTDAPFIRVPHMMKLKFDPIKETTPIIFYGIFTHFVVVPARRAARHHAHHAAHLAGLGRLHLDHVGRAARSRIPGAGTGADSGEWTNHQQSTGPDC